MRARMCVSWALVSWAAVSCIIVVAISNSPACGQSNSAPDASQIAACPTVLPAEEGERSIVVPQLAANIDVPNQYVPHIASLPESPEHEAAKSLLREKLAQRDQLQREIAALRESTKTPEQFIVHIEMVEINRTKLRQLGVDWSKFGDGKAAGIDAAGLLGVKGESAGGSRVSFEVQSKVDPAFLDLLKTLEQRQVSRVLSRPSVVVTSGRPAQLVVGSEVALPQPESPGRVRIEKVGTQVDVTAIALGNNRVRLELRPSIREIDASNSPTVNGVVIPAVGVRQIDTGMEMELGTTSILSGLVQERTEATTDKFGRRGEEKQEIALMLIVTPEIVR